jgi:hypothetical protein
LQIELMSYTTQPEDRVIERYLLDKGVPASFDKAAILRKAVNTSSELLKDILFDFFVADIRRETLRAFPRHRDCSYTGYREVSRDATVRVVASMDASELLDFFKRNVCSQEGMKESALVYSMLAAAKLACPHLFGRLAMPCPPGKCESETGGCRELALQWTKRIQKLVRISSDAFAASKPNYVMTFDFTGNLGYPVTLTVRKS